MRGKTHTVTRIIAGIFITACGRYLDGPDKERGTGFVYQTTCKSCQKVGARSYLRRKCCVSDSPGPHREGCRA